MKKRDVILKGLFLLFPMMAHCQEVVVTDEAGGYLLFDVKGEKNLAELTEEIASFLGDNVQPRRVILEVDSSKSREIAVSDYQFGRHGEFLGHPRNYYAPMTSQEINDIRYIIKTVSSKSLFALAGCKGDLEAAGDRIEHIHPFCFLATVFSNNELKAGMRAVRARGGWVWANFGGGLKESLETESSIGNLKEAHIVDFSKRVQIDPAQIRPLVQNGAWDDLLNLLMVSKGENPNPFDG